MLKRGWCGVVEGLVQVVQGVHQPLFTVAVLRISLDLELPLAEEQPRRSHSCHTQL